MPPSRRRWIAPAALGLALLSLALNALLLAQLSHPERWIEPALRRLAGRAAAGDATLRYTVRIPAGTPLHFDLPVRERFLVAVDTLLPIDTRVQVPFRTPLGTRILTVPIRADIPVRARLPLRVEHTFRLRTRTRQELAIPLEIRLRDLPLEELVR